MPDFPPNLIFDGENPFTQESYWNLGKECLAFIMPYEGKTTLLLAEEKALLENFLPDADFAEFFTQISIDVVQRIMSSQQAEVIMLVRDTENLVTITLQSAIPFTSHLVGEA